MAKFTTNDSRINRQGAPTMQTRVETWFLENPNGSISQCARELNISRPTARKWMPEELQLQKLAAEQKLLAEKKRQYPSKLERIIKILKE